MSSWQRRLLRCATSCAFQQACASAVGARATVNTRSSVTAVAAAAAARAPQQVQWLRSSSRTTAASEGVPREGRMGQGGKPAAAAEEEPTVVQPHIADAPAAPEGFRMIQEGHAFMLEKQENEVFYNKAQVINRDISKAVLRTFLRRVHPQALPDGAAGAKEELDPSGRKAKRRTRLNGPADSSLGLKEEDGPRVLEGLAATGLRAIRYAKEVEGLQCIVANDNDAAAVEAIRRNAAFNKVPEGLIRPYHSDARLLMLTHEKCFDVLDLDPYGSPSIFLDSALQSVADGGLLMCTATDMAVLCGNNSEVCMSKYGAYPLRGDYCHEMAVRILLYSLETAANRYKRHIQPVLSLSIDFYIRVFVRVFTSASEVKQSPSKFAYVHQAVGCKSFHFNPVGRVVSKKGTATKFAPGTVPERPADAVGAEQIGGPIWAEPIHDMDFVKDMFAEVNENKSHYPAHKKMHGILTSVMEELPEPPLFISVHTLSQILKCQPPSTTLFRSALHNAGYRVSSCHASPLGLKTDAPFNVIWDIMRCWVKEHPIVGKGPTSPTDPGTVILSKEPTLKANFARANSALSKAKVDGVARFVQNPANWGPKPRAGRPLKPHHQQEVDTPAAAGDSIEEGDVPQAKKARTE